MREYIDFVNQQVGVYMDAMAGFVGHHARVERQVCRVIRKRKLKENDEQPMVWASYEDPSKPDIIHNRIVRSNEYLSSNSVDDSNAQQHSQAILVFLFTYWEDEIRPRLAKSMNIAVSEIKSDIAFLGTTSISPEYANFLGNTFTMYAYDDRNVEYALTLSKGEAVIKLRQSFKVDDSYYSSEWKQDVFTIFASGRCCYEAYQGVMPVDCDRFDHARVGFAEKAGVTMLRLFELQVCDKPVTLGKDGAAKIFERSVVGGLRKG